MRAHRGTHREGKLHLVKRALQVRGRYRANDGAAFVALDIRLIAADNGQQAAATVQRSDIGIREQWAGHCVKDSMLLPLLSLQDPERSVGVI